MKRQKTRAAPGRARTIQRIAGGITAPRGFRAAAIRAGIKESRKKDDLVLIVSDVPAAVAGAFTTNAVQAACVALCQERLARQQGQAVVVNAGNANACTGADGVATARRTAAAAARALNLPADLVFVCSTGTIGIPLPVEKIERALPALAAKLSPAGGDAAAEAIMTTDTVPKQVALRFVVDGGAVTLGGMAKGAGMIAPNMATLLAFLTTDAAVEPDALQACLADAVETSFNRVLVDGDESTNDTVLVLANGLARNRPLHPRHPDWPRFSRALHEATETLALLLVRDAEGATKFVTVTVRGAADANDARRAARAVALSPLVKTSWTGGDPNWGRVMAALGYSGARLREERVDIDFDGVAAVRGGRAAPGFALKALEAVLAQKEFALTITLHCGDGSHTVHTCDLSEAYVRINAEYMT